MLERSISAEGVVTYVSPLLRRVGVPHAFSTRLGGISAPPFDSLNLGNPNGCAVQDRRDNIWENYRRLQRAARCDDRALTYLHQVHSDGVRRLTRGQQFDNDTKADALVSDDPSRVLSVRVADCVPVLLSNSDGTVVAVVHAGWRGVVAGIVPNALAEMNRDGAARPDQIAAAIGPSIGFDAFEVGGEVLDEFSHVFGPDAPIRRRADGKGYVDLREGIRLQLIAAGIAPAQIDCTDRCTYRDIEEFYSYRRDAGITGRMAAIIGVRPAA